MRFKEAFRAFSITAVTSAFVFTGCGKSKPISPELLKCMRGVGTVAVQWEKSFDDKPIAGVDLRPVKELADVAKALNGANVDNLARSLDSAKVNGVLVSSSLNPQSYAKGSLIAEMSRYRYVSGMRALCIEPAAALYVSDSLPSLPSSSETALTTVARALLKGVEPPLVSSFPEPLRRPRTSEVMVTLLQGNSPRLWRSARGSSIARALITAATVARSRWREREKTMGGSLDKLLPQMDIEVSLLVDDGTVLARAPSFVDQVITPAHGIGYEQQGIWHYVLPEAIALKHKGSAAHGIQRLLEEKGVSERDREGSHLRFYRFAAVKLARSRAKELKRDQ